MCRVVGCGRREISAILIDIVLGFMGASFIFFSTSPPDPCVAVGISILILDTSVYCLNGWKRPAGQLIMTTLKLVAVVWLAVEGISKTCVRCPYDLSASLLTVFGGILLAISSVLSMWSAVINCFFTGSEDISGEDIEMT